jgi:hypothetical protein
MRTRLLIFSGMLIVACTNSYHPKIDVTQISIDIDHPVTLKLSDFFDEVSYILLSDSFLIGDIERVKIVDDMLFLLSNKRIFVYDKNSGNTVLSIRNVGKGHGEYISLYDMFFDKRNNIIELLDMNGKKVLQYGLDGQFINDFDIPFYSFAFHKIDDTNYFFYNNNMTSKVSDNKLVKYNRTTSKVLNQYLSIDKHLARYFFLVDVNNFGSEENLIFHFAPSDTVYGFSEKYDLYPKYYIDLMGHQVPPGFFKADYFDIADFSSQATQRSYIYCFGNFLETSDFAMIACRNDQNSYWTLYDKKHQTGYTANALFDDYHFNTSLPIDYENEPFVMDHECLYFFLQPTQLISLIKNDKTVLLNNEDVQKLYDSPNFSEQSNPILVKCKFKKQ